MVSCTPRIEYAPRLLGPSHLIQAGVDTILPEGHIPRGWFGSATSTTPPSFRFFLFSLHFFLSVTLGICSLVKRFQKKYWQALETVAIISLGWSLSLTNFSLFITRICSQKQKMIWRQRFYITCIVWDMCDKGRLFSTPSALTRAVLRASSATILFCSTDFKVFFAHCTNLSHAPPKWGALGGWKFYSISFGSQKFWTFSSFSCLRNFNSALLAPTKLVPLSLYIRNEPSQSHNEIIRW